MKSLLIALSLLGAAPALAHDYQLGTIHIDHPVAIEPPPLALAAAGYFTLRNSGTEADRLIGVELPPYRAEIHESFEEAGMHKMRPVEAVELPAGGEVVFQSGGLHIMLLGEALQNSPLKLGDKVTGALIFEKAGRAEVVFNVEKRGQSGSAPSHGGHSGH